jgi:hypothetical protein
MTLDEFSEAVSASQRHERWVTSPDPVTEGELAAVEARLGVRFPERFRQFLRRFGAGDFHWVTLLAVSANSDDGLVVVNEALRDTGVSNFVAVAPNGCGDFYGFRTEAGMCLPEVYLWDHETQSVDAEPEAACVLEFLRDNALVLSTDLHLVATGRAHLVSKWWWW